MGIEKYMTVYEATSRWAISRYRLESKLSNDYITQKAINHKILKVYKDSEYAKKNWVISNEFMELFFGKEPIEK